jgi:hypothetical protein
MMFQTANAHGSTRLAYPAAPYLVHILNVVWFLDVVFVSIFFPSTSLFGPGARLPTHSRSSDMLLPPPALLRASTAIPYVLVLGTPTYRVGKLAKVPIRETNQNGAVHIGAHSLRLEGRTRSRLAGSGSVYGTRWRAGSCCCRYRLI